MDHHLVEPTASITGGYALPSAPGTRSPGEATHHADHASVMPAPATPAPATPASGAVATLETRPTALPCRAESTPYRPDKEDAGITASPPRAAQSGAARGTAQPAWGWGATPARARGGVDAAAALADLPTNPSLFAQRQQIAARRDIAPALGSYETYQPRTYLLADGDQAPASTDTSSQ